jgi:hypothetical protein
MNDVVALQFDLTPPSQDELRGLVADLSEDERHMMLEPRHRSTLLRRFPRRETGGRLHLPSVRTASIQGRRKVRKRHRLAELHYSPFRKPPPIHSRHQLRYGPHGDRLHSLRRTPGACLPGWSAANRGAILHQFHLARVHAKWRATAGQTRPGCSRGRGMEELKARGTPRLWPVTLRWRSKSHSQRHHLQTCT